MSYLRDYQQRISDAVIAELSNSCSSTLYVQPTGTGKTQVALDILDRWPDQDCDILCLAHRQELIYQPWNRWREKTGAYAEMEMGDARRSHSAGRVTFASKDSLYPERLRKAYPDPQRVGLIWIDECIAEGEPVWLADGRRTPIERVLVGDRVVCHNGYTTTTSIVTKAWASGVKDIVAIHTVSGVVLRCSTNHPIMTKRGWIPAGKLLPTDHVFVANACGGSFEPLKKIVNAGQSRTYDITVAHNHNFFCNGILVHNCHHCVNNARSYAHILEYFSANPDLRIFGCTATPDRTDEEALGQMFESVAADYPLLDPHGPSAIGDGWVVDIDQEVVTVDEIDFTDVKSRGGDFIDSQLQRMLIDNKAIEKLVAATRQIAGDRKTLLFAPGVEAAILQSLIFNAETENTARAIASRIPDGMDYPWVVRSSDTDTRQRMLKQWNKGLFQYLTNVGVFTEGMDEPTIKVISQCRPTKSRSLYAQMIGRGLRILPGIIEGPNEDGSWWRLQEAKERKDAISASDKPSLLVIDFVGNSRHSLISAADILGGKYPEDVVERAKNKIKAGEADVAQALAEAQEEEIKARQLEARRRVKATASLSRVKIDPFAAINCVVGREPGWHKGRMPTTKQCQALRKFKVEEDAIARMSFHQASTMLDSLISRAKADKCTYKQAKVLTQHGFSPDISFHEASHILDGIFRTKKGPSANDYVSMIDQAGDPQVLDGLALAIKQNRRKFSAEQYEQIVAAGRKRRAELATAIQYR